ncbi:MAG: HEAT repeat domain-containing protein [Phycisphaerae bacterium]
MGSGYRIGFVVSAVLVVLAGLAPAGEPVGYRGINNSGIYPAKGLMDRWPEGGPELVWKYEIGTGYAGPTVTDDRIYIAGGEMSHLYVFSQDGEMLGRYPIAGAGWKRFGGTRSTPLLTGDLVITSTPDSTLYAFDLARKEIRYKINAWKDFGAGKGHMGWGYPATPMLHRRKNLLIFNTCSRMDETPPLVAVDAQTGKAVWKMPAEKNNRDYYSAADVSGALFRHNGRDLVVYPTWRYLVCVDADSGEKLWEIRHVGEKTLTPVYSAGYLLWDTGSTVVMMKLSKNGEDYEMLWERPWPAGYTHAVIMDGRVYIQGNPNHKSTEPKNVVEPLEAPRNRSKERDKTPRAHGLLCLDAETGKLIDWEAVAGRGHIIGADGKIIVTELVRHGRRRTRVPRVNLVVPTKEGFDITGRFVPDMNDGELAVKDVGWQLSANPVVANGRLYLRYGPIMVFELRREKMAEIRKAKAAVARQVKALESPKASERLAAIDRIVKAGPYGRSALMPLLVCLRDDDKDVRSKAAQAVGKLGPMVAPQLIKALRNDQVWKEGLAGQALVKAVDAGDLAEALVLSAESVRNVREDAAELLPKLGGKPVPHVLKVLGRADRYTRWWCIEVLQRIGPEAVDATPELVSVMKTHDQWFRAHAAKAVGHIGPGASQAVDALIEQLSHSFPDARAKAAWALGGIGVADGKVLDALKKATRDKNEDVSTAAEAALKKLAK